MSRCFPYPPPGYCRNGAAHEALIESIKLQKETDKAKAERRKEKREKKEKKKAEKEKRKNDEKLKLLQKNQSQDSQKLLQKQADGKKSNTELLEKSDLTQEHGQPIKPCYSSDSTQNSNKRRRDDDNDVDGLLPDDSTGHGKHIKIRLLKKHKGSDSTCSGDDAKSETVPLVPSSSLDRTLLVSSNRNTGVPATSGRENNAGQWIPLAQTKSNPCFERIPDRSPNGLQLGRDNSAKPTLPSLSRKSDVDVLKSSRQQQLKHQQQIASFIRPVVPQSQLKHEAPSSTGVSRNIGVQGPTSVRHQPSLSTLKPVVPGSVLTKPSPVTTGKRPINEVTVPCSSGPGPGPGPSPSPMKVQKEDQKKVGPSRAEKKMMKKQAKYEKLICSWVPPVFQAIPTVIAEDEDWLSRRTKPESSSISRGEVESCRELATTSLWQPRARYLAEGDIYALPYTVPF